MKREINIEEISANNLYDDNDMARIGCNDCAGCSDCCHFSSDTIILDPSDMYRLEKGLNMKFEELYDKYISLRMVDGLSLPYLIVDEGKGCRLLSENGRCTIHEFRPGNCRLFPLARIYENGDYRYFVQKNQCTSDLRIKVKIKDWIGIADMRSYRRFLNTWHELIKKEQEKLANADNETRKAELMKLLQVFYLTPYDLNRDFYEQFDERLLFTVG